MPKPIPLAAALLAIFTLPAAAQPSKIAVIGLLHGHVWGHLPALVKSSDVKLVGIAETVPDLIAEARRVAGPDIPIYSDYKKMLDEAKPDIVWSFVENNRHLEIVQACAPRKIHIMFEKPLASTYKDALAIRDLADKYGIQVLCNYQMAWWPANYAAKKEVDSGSLGKVWRLRGIVGHGGPGSTGIGKYFFDWLTDPVRNGGGALVDFGCYNALWGLWYFGQPETVYAEVLHLRPGTFPKVEDSATLALHWKHADGVFEGSWDLPRSHQDLEVFGLEGSVYMTQRGVEVRKSRGQATQVAPEPLPPERAQPIAYMVDALRNHHPIEGLTALDINVGVVEIIEAARDSVKTGRAVKLPLK
ncbi:MAG: Gfo/Idh/MocA family oxidoreductase [Acidobacteriia bacterium]|nr:Gfo/Idh/MocA family oxidoreductase [Terriglobia bacterium]